MTSSEIIFYIGLALVGCSALATVILVPILIVVGVKLRKQLDLEYGERSLKKKGRKSAL